MSRNVTGMQADGNDWKKVVAQHRDISWVQTDVVVELTLSGAPGGDDISLWSLSSGTSTIEETDRTPEVVVSIAWSDAVEIVRGAVCPAVAYMRGKLKPSGDMEKVLALLQDTSTGNFFSWVGSLRADSLRVGATRP